MRKEDGARPLTDVRPVTPSRVDVNEARKPAKWREAPRRNLIEQ